jgi:hypothetical protein
LVVERNPVSRTEYNLQNRSNSLDVSAGCLFVDDNTRADAEFSIPFSFFHVLPQVSFCNGHWPVACFLGRFGDDVSNLLALATKLGFPA